MSYSNITKEELLEKEAQLKKQRSCPACGAHRDRAMQMGRFEDEIVSWLRTNNVTKRDSCLDCVKKHIGYALALCKESLTLNKDVKGSVMLNHLETIGELRAATEEASQYPVLYDYLLDIERQYRYQGTIPNWIETAQKIDDVYTSKDFS